MPKDPGFDAAAARAANATDQELGQELPRLPGPKWDEIRAMLPEPSDQQALDELRRIVSQDSEHNEKVAALLESSNKVIGVVVKMMERAT